MGHLQHHNPPGLHQHPAFSQAVAVSGASSLLFIGGQNAVDETGAVIGDSVGEQTVRALQNVQIVVESAGGSLADIVKWTVLLTDPARAAEGFAAFVEFWDPAVAPPAVTVQVVAALADPRFLVEIEAVAALAP